VLLLGSEKDLPSTSVAADLVADPDGKLQAEVCRAVFDAVQKVTTQPYDAVICWAESDEELSGIIRLRKAKPEIPILVVSSRDESQFGELARRMGASRVLSRNRNLSATLGSAALALEALDLARKANSWSREIHSRARQVQKLVKETGSLVRQARSGTAAPSSSVFVPLVVEDDSLQAHLMTRAFAKARIEAPLPILTSGEEAIEYLGGSGKYSDRGLHPLPSIVLCDVNLPGKSGLDVLRWIKSTPALRDLRVVLLSSMPAPEHVNQAYESGAEAYLTKPTSYAALVELVSGLRGGARRFAR
jgi:CheY-like chemotaxis protein